MRKTDIFAFAKTKEQISFAVIANLISAFVFAIRIVQFLLYITQNFKILAFFCDRKDTQACVGPGQNPKDRFSRVATQILTTFFS